MKNIYDNQMSITNIAFAFVATAAIVAAEPRCFQIGRMLHGLDLPARCVHGTHDYSVSYPVDDGCVKFHVPSKFKNVPELELYTGERMLSQYDDCCPPETFTRAIECKHVPPSGQCCYNKGGVHVWDLPEDAARCVHDIETYSSYVPEKGAAWWNSSKPESNTEVEIYGHLDQDGCCVKFFYAIPCSPCEQEEREQ